METVRFKYVKTTKLCIKFEELAKDPDDHRIGMIYIRRNYLPNPFNENNIVELTYKVIEFKPSEQ